MMKSPEEIVYLHGLVLAEPAITDVAKDITPSPQQWGQSGFHFAAHHRVSAEPLLLKINVSPKQLWWTEQLARVEPELLPHVYATGVLPDTEPLGWVLWERIPNGLHPGWQGREFDMLLEAGVRFQLAAYTLAEAATAAATLDTLQVEQLRAGLERGIQQGAPGPAAQVHARVFDDWAWVHQVCETAICHGDLHMANALCRSEPPAGTALLIDFHPTLMPWAYESAKPEILNADPQRPGCRGLVTRQAAMRTARGLSAPGGATLARLEAIVLGWWAIQLWGYIGSTPDPAWRDPAVWWAENEAYIAAAANA
jgi:hypothetical protein